MQRYDDVLDNILDANSDELMETSNQESQWIKLELVLYQPIVITRANVTTIKDKVRGDVERAFVNFFFEVDETRTRYVFSTGWGAIKRQVEALARAKAFPVTCGIVEILTNGDGSPVIPFVSDEGKSFFPLRFVKSEHLHLWENAASDTKVLMSPENSAKTANKTGQNFSANTAIPGSALKSPKGNKPVFGNKGN